MTRKRTFANMLAAPRQESFLPFTELCSSVIATNSFTAQQCHHLNKVKNKCFYENDLPSYYSKEFPVIKTSPQLSSNMSEYEQSTNFFLAENYRQINHNYPTPSPSPHSEVENEIEHPMREDRLKRTPLKTSKKPQKLSYKCLLSLNNLDQTLKLNNHGEIRRHVNFKSSILSFMGESIYNQVPTDVFSHLDELLRQGFKIKNELIDLLNRIVPEDYAYNPNKSHIVLDYDKITLMVIRLLNNVASRRSRYRKKFSNHVKLNCLKIDMDENILLHKQQCSLQDIIRKMECKMLNVVMNHDTMLAFRDKCGLV